MVEGMIFPLLSIPEIILALESMMPFRLFDGDTRLPKIVESVK